MTREGARWQRVQDLCVAALDCDPAERQAFLTTACGGDADLRQEIESLIAQEAHAEGFLSASTLERWAVAVVPRASVSHVGHAFGPYDIQALIGTGGMGEVYRARDRRLDRDVAVKVLPAAFSRDPDRLRRFEQEARAAAALNHPNILAVYDIGSHDGEPYIVSEFLAGETLAQRLTRGPLSLADAVDVAIQLGHALAAAHEIGIVHRDLKPANIFITHRQQVKVLDFGVAKIRESDPPAASGMGGLDEAVTTPGIGTLAYMSPEQITGAQVDPRLDVWSLGVVLYEMVTGQRPFRGATRQAVAMAITSATPTPPSQLRPDVQHELECVLTRALAKHPDDRYHDEDLISDLQRVRLVLSQPPALVPPGPGRSALKSGRVLPRRGSRAVGWAMGAIVLMAGIAGLARRWQTVPTLAPSQPRELVLIGAFDNRTGAPTLDGIVEAAIQRELASSQAVSVTSQQRIDDTLRLMAQPLDTRLQADVAREVCLRDGGIRAFVTGRIDRIGDDYAITASVVDPVDDRVIHTVKSPVLDDTALSHAVPQLASRISADLDQSISAIHPLNEHIEKVTTPSLQAARLFSRGLRVFNLEQFTSAEAQFRAALEADPSFASAHIWLAWTCLNLRQPTKECLSFAQRAMDLAPSVSLHEREWIAASYYMMNDEDERAIAEYEALLRRYPDDTWAFYNLRRLYGDNSLKRNSLDLEARVADAQPNNFLVQAQVAAAFLASEGLAAARPRVEQVRLLMPAPNASADGRTMQAVIWTLLFPAQEFWTEGRATESAHVLDDVSHRPEFGLERDRTLSMLGTMRLSLGQIHLAEDAFNRISNSGERGICLAQAALARDDNVGVVARLRESSPNDAGVASLLIRAGQLDEAATFLRSIPPAALSPKGNHARWSANELEEASGDRATIEGALGAGAPWTQIGISLRTFLYSETLARSAASIGNRAAAIKVLEETAPAGARDFSIGGTHGYFWMRDQKLLADLYREDGQQQKAVEIERDLLARLAVADPDFPLLIELKQRVGK